MERGRRSGRSRDRRGGDVARPSRRLAAARRTGGEGNAGVDAVRRVAPGARDATRRARTCRSRSRTPGYGTIRRFERPSNCSTTRAGRDRRGRYQFEAAIQSAHVARRMTGVSNWPVVVQLYDHLFALTGSPVVVAQPRGGVGGGRTSRMHCWTVRSRRSPMTSACSRISHIGRRAPNSLRARVVRRTRRRRSLRRSG